MRTSYLLVSLLSLSCSLHAQVARTALNGTVTDPQGKAVPSAKVRAISLATGLKREVETGIEGTYALADLDVGNYLIEIGKEGFSTVRLQTVKLEVGQTRTLDVTLTLAGRNEQVSVTEATFQLDRVDATIGAPIVASTRSSWNVASVTLTCSFRPASVNVTSSVRVWPTSSFTVWSRTVLN